ncbi:uncharacterized protein LOC128251599 [Octopus bimaculoides]|uniref:uncharacterized protein LOC128251599 n=1 Tax=Octopus bimaculoides TaxID=37653 RepID=UPI0022E17C07|nr:uncharacterized protein LOC128251599 [Octopus bimaculoides]XP_052834551.1 uncharacterized protein LOC128251599 [Octopus bimaculoides]
MGSSLSGLLAITYMNHLERRALNICRSCAFFTRYVDDILILTTFREEAERIFTTVSNTDMNIKFTIEHLDITGSPSLLDFKLNITEEGKIHTEFYRKAASRDMFVQYNSALPLGAKIVYARNELAHIQGKCSRTGDKVAHTTRFLDILKTNGYPRSIVNRLKYPRRPTRRTQRKHSNTCFLKIPQFSERITTAIRRAIRKGLDIQLAHSGPSLRGHLAKKRTRDNNQCTLTNCPIRDTDLCQRVNVVFRIQCNKCNKFYVGITTRPLHVRIKKHLNTRASHFRKHLDRCRNTGKSITLTIEANERILGSLIIKEAILIHRLGPQLTTGWRLVINILFSYIWMRVGSFLITCSCIVYNKKKRGKKKKEKKGSCTYNT